MKRPCAHYRIVKTKRGRKKILVNPSVKKKVKRARPLGWDSSDEALFQKKGKELGFRSSEQIRNISFERVPTRYLEDVALLKQAERQRERSSRWDTMKMR